MIPAANGKFTGDKTLVKDYFMIEYGQVFVGYHDPDDRWNGWACPWFPIETVRKMAAAPHGAGLELTPDGKVLDHGDPNDDFVTMTFEWMPERKPTEDGELELYPVGNGCWIWSDVPEPEEDYPQEYYWLADTNGSPYLVWVPLPGDYHAEEIRTDVLYKQPLLAGPFPTVDAAMEAQSTLEGEF